MIKLKVGDLIYDDRERVGYILNIDENQMYRIKFYFKKTYYPPRNAELSSYYVHNFFSYILSK